MKRREAKEEAEKAVTKLTFVFSNYIQLEPAIHERRKRNTHTPAHIAKQKPNINTPRFVLWP